MYSPGEDAFVDGPAGMVANAPRSRYRHSAAVLGKKIFVVGGRDLNDDIVQAVDVLDTSTGTWETLPWTWTTPKSDNDAFTMNGYIYAVGGYYADYTVTRTTDILDPDAGWTLGSAHVSIAEMNEARGDFALVEGGDGLFCEFNPFYNPTIAI